MNQTLKNKLQDIVEEAATAQVKEETTSNLRSRDVGAPITLRSFAHTDWKRRNGCLPVGYSGQEALSREQCVMSTESWKFNQKTRPLLGYNTIKSEATAECETLHLHSNSYLHNGRRNVRSSVSCAVCPGGCVTVQYHSCKNRCFLLGP
jgi:hypothetical protein